ncbi:MAG: 50S ribosomal protein L20 [Acidobacteria bacterium]|nr:50S ribosomal protein L20 [Acidobacteriota bacterium]
MPRVRRGNKRLVRRKKTLSLAKGYWGTKSKLHRSAKEAVERALKFAYLHRRTKKRDFRSLWIVRISAAAKLHNLSYSKFMLGLRKAGVNLNRKMLAEIAATDQAAFKSLVDTANKALNAH